MNSASSRLAKTMSDIAFGAPYVITIRMMGLMTPGALLSARQRSEATRMVAEKQLAAMESCTALVLSYQRNLLGFWTSILFFGKSPAASSTDWTKTIHAAAKPYQRRVTSNAARLRKRSRTR